MLYLLGTVWFNKTQVSPKYYLIYSNHIQIKEIINLIWVDMFHSYHGAKVNTEVLVAHLELISAPALRSILMMLT